MIGRDRLDLEVNPADAVRFVPVQLNPPELPVWKPNRGDALALPPAPATIDLLESGPDPDASADAIVSTRSIAPTISKVTGLVLCHNDPVGKSS